MAFLTLEIRVVKAGGGILVYVYWQAGVMPIREPLAVSSGSSLIKPRQGRRRPLGRICPRSL